MKKAAASAMLAGIVSAKLIEIVAPARFCQANRAGATLEETRHGRRVFHLVGTLFYYEIPCISAHRAGCAKRPAQIWFSRDCQATSLTYIILSQTEYLCHNRYFQWETRTRSPPAPSPSSSQILKAARSWRRSIPARCPNCLRVITPS